MGSYEKMQVVMRSGGSVNKFGTNKVDVALHRSYAINLISHSTMYSV